VTPPLTSEVEFTDPLLPTGNGSHIWLAQPSGSLSVLKGPSSPAKQDRPRAVTQMPGSGGAGEFAPTGVGLRSSAGGAEQTSPLTLRPVSMFLALADAGEEGHATPQIQPGDAELSATSAGADAHSRGTMRTGYLLWAAGLGGLFLGRLFVPATRRGGIIPR